VRSYECFKYLHLEIISGIERKSIPEIAKVVSLKSGQALHHFIACITLVSNPIKRAKIIAINRLLADS
jgi:SRSO17 transposase